MKPTKGIHIYHRTRLKDGTYTDGDVDPETLVDRYLYNALDFKGKSVLDIGTWSGWYAFEAERRGAALVHAIDPAPDRAGFDFLKDHFQSKVERYQLSVDNLSPLPHPQYDIVLLFGVLYHRTDPLLAFLNALKATRQTLLAEGLFYSDPNNRPSLELLAPQEVHPYKDHSNVYRLSFQWLAKVAKLAGCEITQWNEAAYPPHPLCGRGSIRCERKSSPSVTYPAWCYPTQPFINPS